MDIGTKVALAVAAAALCVASTVGLLVHRITAADQLATARSDLDRQLMSAVYDHAAGRKSAARLDPPDLPAAVSKAVRRGDRVTYLQDGPDPVLWAATRVSDRTVLALSRPYGHEADELAALDRTLVTTGAAATAGVSLAGLALGVRMGRRATAAARTAERIAHGDLNARIGPQGRDEIARLAASVNAMADALGARLEAERRVTADIAHELRTPVTAMVTATGLLPPGPATDLVAGGVRKLRGLVEDVLEVARLDAHAVSVETEPRQVSAMARRAVTGLDGAEGRVEVRIVTDTLAETDPRRVERILTNLVTNALRHGTPQVTVEVDAETNAETDGDGAGPLVRIRDHGPGFPPDLLAVLTASGPQRFRTGCESAGTGLGLGLTIASGQARLLGARLTFRNHPDGGAEATLRLPPTSPSPGSTGAAAAPVPRPRPCPTARTD
ncbi:HAMP domain-containing sensor histidine kinase [Streptomyces sp. T12]|uniref:HAMP domain-containing sensor histidine kinase n=3 Tax=unclassified Streptomyces TaxID=2593676 RepID=UPI0023658C78|nr:HAMP domain-containing sensor histidine kinase [Streptomyces sp. T12]WDF41213.1 HAMP domain-containing sensor histidine kinase [Streptomyces sp. T12]